PSIIHLSGHPPTATYTLSLHAALPISLQYASAQILFGINDHAARMTIPFLHIGGILAAYLLGRVMFGRRTGWALAALWGLYPHADRKSTRLNSSHVTTAYAVCCLNKNK